jgi:hypothetical protein
LCYDCAGLLDLLSHLLHFIHSFSAPASTPFDQAIGPMASAAGAPRVASLRTIKSDVVVGLGDDGDEIAEKLDKYIPSLVPFFPCLTKF